MEEIILQKSFCSSVVYFFVRILCQPLAREYANAKSFFVDSDKNFIWESQLIEESREEKLQVFCVKAMSELLCMNIHELLYSNSQWAK